MNSEGQAVGRNIPDVGNKSSNSLLYTSPATVEARNQCSGDLTNSLEMNIKLTACPCATP